MSSLFLLSLSSLSFMHAFYLCLRIVPLSHTHTPPPSSPPHCFLSCFSFPPFLICILKVLGGGGGHDDKGYCESKIIYVGFKLVDPVFCLALVLSLSASSLPLFRFPSIPLPSSFPPSLSLPLSLWSGPAAVVLRPPPSQMDVCVTHTLEGI